MLKSGDPSDAEAWILTEFNAGQKMVWSGGMSFGLFKGVRTFTLSPQGSATKFTMREEFTDPLLNMIWKSMPDLGPSFEQFANGLKRRAEQETTNHEVAGPNPAGQVL